MKNIMVIYNDTSGSNDGEERAQEFATYAKEKLSDCTITFQVTNPDVDSEEVRQTAKDTEIDTIVMIGGDGTLHHVIKMFADEINQYQIGIIPGGTVNNFARSLGIPMKLTEAYETILAQQTHGVDYGQVNDDVMISTLTIGLLADTAARVSQSEKQKLGPLAFARSFFKLLAKQKRYHLNIQTNKENWSGKAQLVTITMTNSAGGYMYFDTLATPDDGLFHITVLPKLSFPHLVAALPKILYGKLNEIDGIKHFAASDVKITTTNKKVQTRTDGDPTDDLPIDMRVHKQALQIFIPNGELPDVNS